MVLSIKYSSTQMWAISFGRKFLYIVVYFNILNKKKYTVRSFLNPQYKGQLVRTGKPRIIYQHITHITSVSHFLGFKTPYRETHCHFQIKTDAGYIS